MSMPMSPHANIFSVVRFIDLNWSHRNTIVLHMFFFCINTFGKAADQLSWSWKASCTTTLHKLNVSRKFTFLNNSNLAHKNFCLMSINLSLKVMIEIWLAVDVSICHHCLYGWIYRHKLMSREYHCAAHVLFVFTHLARQLISIHVHRVHCTPCGNWNAPFSNNLPSAHRKFCLVSRNSSLRVRIEIWLTVYVYTCIIVSVYLST